MGQYKTNKSNFKSSFTQKKKLNDFNILGSKIVKKILN